MMYPHNNATASHSLPVALDNTLSRRDFVRSAAAAAAASTILAPLSVAASAHVAGSDTLKVGLIGCGGRGTGAAGQAIAADPGVVISALADAFPDRLASCRAALTSENSDRMQLSDDRCFVGFDGYQRLLDSGVDVVLLATPTVFRPIHLRAAVDAGKHIFCEKPMAVDGPGVRSILAAAADARKRNLSLVSGFCWRYSDPERATMQQIHEGAIGEIRAVYTTYNTSPLGTHPREAAWSDMEWQLRNWHHFTWASGDHIVEQACHSIDKMAWAFNGLLPTQATAVGGRQARHLPEHGNSYDHFSVAFEFPTGARGFHMCRQIDGCSNDNSDYILGSSGICSFNGWVPTHVIRGETNWKYEGERRNMYQTEHDELFASIRSGKPMNDGEWMAHSTLMAIMGRMCAYTGQTITWDQALNSSENLTPDSWAWTDRPVPPVAIPGQTKFT